MKILLLLTVAYLFTGCQKQPARPFAITTVEAIESRPSTPHEPATVTPTADVGRDLKYDVTVYCFDGCGPCESIKKRDGAGDEEIRLTYKTEPPPRGIPEMYPAYVWTDSKGSLRYVNGAHQLPKLLNIIERKRNDPPQRRASQ